MWAGVSCPILSSFRSLYPKLQHALHRNLVSRFLRPLRQTSVDLEDSSTAHNVLGLKMRHNVRASTWAERSNLPNVDSPTCFHRRPCRTTRLLHSRCGKETFPPAPAALPVAALGHPRSRRWLGRSTDRRSSSYSMPRERSTHSTFSRTAPVPSPQSVALSLLKPAPKQTIARRT